MLGRGAGDVGIPARLRALIFGYDALGCQTSGIAAPPSSHCEASVLRYQRCAMTLGSLSAIITFLAGIILLLVWMYATTGNPRSTTILLKSILLFVVPGTVLAALSPMLFHVPLGLWVAVLLEECLKAIGAVTEKNRSDCFFLVVLFGVWEFILIKPLLALLNPLVTEGMSTSQLLGITIGSMMAVLMHAVTAEIYAFKFSGKIAPALAMSWLIHTLYDESVNLLGISLSSSLVQFLILILLFVGLWPRKQATV